MAEKALKSPLEQLRQLADSERGRIQISGISESRAAAVAAWLIREERDKALVLSPSPERAKRLAADLSFFADRPVYCLPEEENGLLRFDAKSHETLEARFRALAAFCGEEPCVLVAGGSALLRRLPPRAVSSGAGFSIRAGGSVEPEELMWRLTERGCEGLP